MILVTNNEATKGAPVSARMLAEGRPILDALEAGIREVEEDESVRTVGRGGWPNLLGEVELDAGIIDGTTLRTGAVGGLRGFLHPISVARAVMERLPHELVVGEGAARLAREIGAEAGDLLMPHARDAWDAWFRDEVGEAERRAWPDVPMADLCRHAIDPEIGRDTTVFLAQDRGGGIAAATSTSGWGWKYPGRIGDSPVVGAGFYADTRYGAAACTGVGEMTIRCGTSRAIVLYMKRGATVDEAVREAVDDMRALKGGLIGRVTVHAIDARGGHKVAAVNGDGTQTYWFWDGGGVPASRTAEPITISEAGALPSVAPAAYVGAS